MDRLVHRGVWVKDIRKSEYWFFNLIGFLFPYGELITCCIVKLASTLGRPVCNTLSSGIGFNEGRR